MGRQTTMSGQDVVERVAAAKRFLLLAQSELAEARSQAPSDVAQTAASNAILAGIMAADALTGRQLGVRANDADHRAAIALLATVVPDGPSHSKRLARLLKDKSLLQYGGFCTTAKAADMVRQAEKLVEAMAAVVRG